ncbi:MAG: envelope stress response membrane protein PspC [Desulfobacteraceae bacterium]|nr:MAG: envelope stress response membrane protein PspC [Desulfobacteraceae bacterium]
MKRYYRRHGRCGDGYGGRFNERFGRFKNRLNRISEGNGFYRSRRGVLMGVCKGIADYFNFNVFWTRLITFVLFLITGIWPVGVCYVIAGLIMKMEPVAPLHSETDKEFYDTYTQSHTSAIQRIKRKFENIERRIQRMEHTVTSREFDWK